MDEKRLPQILIGYLLEEGKEGDQKQDGKKVYLELWKKVIYEEETGRKDFVGHRMSKDISMCHRITTYIHQ
jgi:hypothetical protein